jgi:uncharacterized membrane protein
MLPFAALVVIVGAIVAFVGVAMVIRSLFSAARRGQPIALRFWAPAVIFERDELSDNRLGFVLSIVGIVIMLVAVYLLWPN